MVSWLVRHLPLIQFALNTNVTIVTIATITTIVTIVTIVKITKQQCGG